MAKKTAAPATIEEKMKAALVPAEKQPYVVPDNWCWTQIKNLCVLNNGRAFKPTDWTDHGLPIIRIQNLNNPDNPFNYFDGQVEESVRLYGGELLFAWSGTPGTSFGAHIWYGRDAVLNQHIFRVDFNENCLLKPFFMYAINQQLNQLITSAHGGAGLQHVTKGVFESTPIPLPPRAEQRRIVDLIETMFAKLDKTKEKVQTVIDGYEDRKAAILHMAFTGELTAQIRTEKSVDFSSWKKTNLGAIVSGFKYGSSEKSEYLNAGTPVFRIPNIGDGNIDFDDMKYLSDEIDETYLVQENDILIIRSNGSRDLVGKCAIVPRLERRYAYASFLIKIIPSAEIRPDFLVRFLNSSDARSQMFAKAKSSSGIHNINSKELGSIILMLPEQWEQEQIVTIIDDLLAKEAAVKEAAENTLTTVDAMKQSILARAFRGELGTNDPNDEPAEELLKRILLD